jgi:hypothetical protein
MISKQLSLFIITITCSVMPVYSSNNFLIKYPVGESCLHAWRNQLDQEKLLKIETDIKMLQKENRNLKSENQKMKLKQQKMESSIIAGMQTQTVFINTLVRNQYALLALYSQQTRHSFANHATEMPKQADTTNLIISTPSPRPMPHLIPQNELLHLVNTQINSQINSNDITIHENISLLAQKNAPQQCTTQALPNSTTSVLHSGPTRASNSSWQRAQLPDNASVSKFRAWKNNQNNTNLANTTLSNQPSFTKRTSKTTSLQSLKKNWNVKKQ